MGDTLIVWRLDRLGRSLKDLIVRADELRERGIGLRSLQESIDTSSSGGELIFHMFGALAQFERALIRERTHMPAGSDGTRPTARSKGKVERPFRTVKEAHETLYHFHKPETEAEANLWLRNYVDRYNDKPHRREPHSRIEDWLANLPEAGLREMCSWERFCAFAREPERRRVGGDAHISVQGARYEVDPDLAGEGRDAMVRPLRPRAVRRMERQAVRAVSRVRRADPAALVSKARKVPT